ncbi:nicotinamide-nucleotide amidohydrolase family protein, partial [Candidatus Omnitrophota bacterium]
KQIQAMFKENIYGFDAQLLEQTVAQQLAKKKKTIAVAESCTGGLIAQRLTNLSGSSKYFPLGLIVYSNQAKQSLLGVPKDVLKKSGAVSKEVARIMAQNIKDLAKTDLGLGVTGIAGPTGGNEEKPVGLVYIALASARKLTSQEFYFHGNREKIRLRASQAALDLVRRHLM